MSLSAAVLQLQRSPATTIHPRGNSMQPHIRSGDEVVLTRVVPARLEVGDIVLVRVKGSVYLHLVRSVEPSRRRVQIANAAGHVNGWTSFDRVYGIATSVAGRPVPGAAAKSAPPAA